jgi:chromate transporter
VREVFTAALRLGLTSFGGPIAHLGYFRREYVERRHWLDEASYADLVALCQSLPGPASSQLGIAIGTRRAGPLGGVAAWLGFTLPSAIILVLFARLTGSLDPSGIGWVHGLKIAAVAVVFQAVLAMGRTLTADWPRRAIAAVAAAVALAWASPYADVAIIASGALVGRFLLVAPAAREDTSDPSPVSRRGGIAALATFVILLVGLPLVRIAAPSGPLALFDTFFRAGALVFGGGHVVLPLLHGAVVDPGWVSNDRFLAGYGAAQAVPGPLFTFAAYLGAVATVSPSWWAGATIALVAIFLPSFLLIFGTLPFWDVLRRSSGFRRALAGTNAAVVGILLAALYTPIATSAIGGPADVAVALAAIALLILGKAPPILVVALAAIVGQLGA